MKYRRDQRVLGAIRWIDAITRAPIPSPLVAVASPPHADTLRFVRNLSGLSVISHAAGLAPHTETLDLADLRPADRVTPLTLQIEGEVSDPTGLYLPRKFTVALPLNPSPALAPDGTRPPNSLFTPVELELLPAPAARLPAGWAQVRVLIQDAEGQPIPHALARVVATADDTPLGYGQSDARGETLVAIPGLKNFAPGATEDEVVTVETAARLEIVLPPDESPTDWTVLRASPVAAASDIDDEPLTLSPGRTYSRRYPFAN
ncbi:MAG: hypothetical protein H7067_00365 [Burkholderiales bacterium]|nr:hypothetical protein [Opitutaceae bacterium]